MKTVSVSCTPALSPAAFLWVVPLIQACLVFKSTGYHQAVLWFLSVRAACLGQVHPPLVGWSCHHLLSLQFSPGSGKEMPAWTVLVSPTSMARAALRRAELDSPRAEFLWVLWTYNLLRSSLKQAKPNMLIQIFFMGAIANATNKP